jgi:hypothetical protein
MLMRMLVKTTQAFRTSPPMSGRFGLIACGGVCVYPLSAVVLIMVPPLRRVTFGKSAPKVTKNALLPVGPDFVGFLHSGLAPWARAERTSLS